MKITNGSLEGTTAAQTSRTQEVERSGVKRPGGPGTAGQGGDSVQLSGLSTQLMDAAAADETRLTGRVSALAAVYARGEYTVDATALGRALVSHALGGAVDGDA